MWVLEAKMGTGRFGWSTEATFPNKEDADAWLEVNKGRLTREIGETEFRIVDDGQP